MKRVPKESPANQDEREAYILEVASKYHDQLEYLNSKKDRIKRISIAYSLVFGLLGAM